MKTTNWFTSWFDTSYYHTLYKHRNDADAQYFMRNITSFLELPQKSHIADLACGKGRHSLYLNSLNYKVTGGDLSKNSIEYAKQFENESLHFEVWDMRNPMKQQYDAVFNLFTSFGYFDEQTEDIAVLKNIKNSLKEHGIFVLDFLNVQKVEKSLVKSEIKIVDNIEFNIKREIKDGFILKHISFIADQKQHNYTEKVKFLTLAKMQSYFKEAGLNLKYVFGDYGLNDFDKETSDRLILIGE